MLSVDMNPESPLIGANPLSLNQSRKKSAGRMLGSSSAEWRQYGNWLRSLWTRLNSIRKRRQIAIEGRWIFRSVTRFGSLQKNGRLVDLARNLMTRWPAHIRF